ncbi:MAG: 4-hydroxy-tetrahydrodipicolinate reductase [Alphaproteobacteria bacterium]|nr:4-hydroxy-tetrahydrodipicolinate reductase [Alphaproteobacteria bacterium]
MLRIGLVGAAGRMGQTLAAEVTATAGCALVAACERPGHAALGQDLGTLAGLGALGLTIGDDAAAVFRAADAVLDFTAPAATVAHARLAAAAGRILVVGTTGLKPEEDAELSAAATRAVIVQAPNMSVGVNLLVALTRRVAAILGTEYDIEIVEMHHKHKVDAPSGTALALGRAAAAGRGVVLESVADRGRDGLTGARKAGAIGFAALRGGDVVGEHTVIFAAPGERVELTHKATARGIFARGAVRAALWAHGKPAGRYDLADVLGLPRE